MSKFRQFIVYAKLAIIVIIVAAVGLVVFMNRNNTTKFWPGASDAPVSTLWLMLATGIASIVLFWILTKLRRVLREVAELSAEKTKADALAKDEQRRHELVEQERRIDEKLKKALDPDKSQPAP